MNLSCYPPILDAMSCLALKNEVEMFNPLPGNMWLGIYDEPENTIEKFIQDSFDFYFKETYNFSGIPFGNPVGFEWWFHVFDEDDRMIGFHSDHDEMVRREQEGEMRYPFCSVEIYLTNHTSPSMILDTITGKYDRDLRPFPPREMVFSLPEEGAMVAYDSRYIHGIGPNQNKGRMSLWYNVWHYRPKALGRIGMQTNIVDCRFYKQDARSPVKWLGETGTCTSDCMDKRVTFKYPKHAKEGEVWSVNQ